MRDFNFVLRSEIFVHTDGQLRASHLILNVNSVYSTWQSFSESLLVDNLLLSYIDVQHANFLSPSLTTRKALNLNPRYTTAEDLAPMRDESTECMSQSQKSHIPVEGPDASTQATEPGAVDPTHSLEATVDLGEEMVTRWALTVDRFLLSTRSASQSQQLLGRDRTPPPPSGRAKKK